MKKLIFAAAVAAGMGAFALESANVVGYTTRDINNKFVISAGQFDSVGGSEFSIQNVGVTAPATVNAWLTFDPDADEFYDNAPGWEQKAPQIQIPNADGSGYTIRFYVSDARDPLYETNLGPGWVGPDGCLADATIPAGMGIWTRGYKNGDTAVENTSLMYPGEVNGDDSQNISLSDKFQLRSVPYPKALSLNGVNVADWTVLTPGKAWQTFDPDADEFYDNISGWEQSAPQIQIPNADGSGYSIRFYVSDARDPLYETNLGPGWVGPDGCLADATIPVGIGVWFNARKAVNVPINK